tara:strand:- start:680 stop:1090 length:411 start_codon:yes stop_codon:yes gene_type:complete
MNNPTTISFIKECKELLKNKGTIPEIMKAHRQGMGQALRQYARYLKETNSKLESISGLIVTPLKNILFEITEIDKNFEIINEYVIGMEKYVIKEKNVIKSIEKHKQILDKADKEKEKYLKEYETFILNLKTVKRLI